MTKYGDAVKHIGKTFLSGKGQTLQDYNDYMKQPGNRGNELSLHLYAHMCQKEVAVITKQTFTTQENSTTVAMVLFKFLTVTWS